MESRTAQTLIGLVGQTPLLKIPSLSKLSEGEIFMKCEFVNPGGSIKDRAALGMVQDGLASGLLRPGMTIVEGTAGNTGIGLAIVAKVYGFKMLVVMPRGQAVEKERMIALHGADLHLVDAGPFSNPNHFYHTARRYSEEQPERYWWANQFENLANFRTHRDTTGPEILAQVNGRVDALVSAAGTGGTIAGCSAYLKQHVPGIKVVLADPAGSGLYSYLRSGEFKSEGTSMTEGIGIMRLTANFAQAKLDSAVQISDRDLVTIARLVRDQDGLVLGSSSALNAAAALWTALRLGPGKRVVTFSCDLGERSSSKLWNPDYLKQQHLDPDAQSIAEVVGRYRQTPVADVMGGRGGRE